MDIKSGRDATLLSRIKWLITGKDFENTNTTLMLLRSVI